ncbi:hypothetical protein SUDANB95_01158 [Actinosynnema sp. ALI-1.44]
MEAVPTLGGGLPVVASVTGPAEPVGGGRPRVGLGLPRVGGSNGSPPVAHVQRTPSSGGEVGGPVLGMASALRVLPQPVVESPASARVEQHVVQRTEEVAPAAEVPVEQAPASAAQPPNSAAPAQQAPAEPEELLKKLYDPLLRRLKAELWLDRERRGLLTDRWH